LNVARWLDAWRVAVLAHHGAESAGAARIVRLFHEQSWADPSSLTTIAALRAGNLRVEKALNELDLVRAEAVLVRDFPVGPEEQEELSALPDVTDARAASASAIAEWVWRDFVVRDQLVLSTSSARMGEALLRALRARLRPEEVGAVLRARPSEDNAADVERFSDQSPGGCHVLVCDTAAEEGLNLQTAGLLVLLDAPLDAGRVEQRVGRIDRHGVPDPVKVVPVVPTVDESGPWRWFEVLRDGYRVFDRSIAAFQVPVAELTAKFARVLYEAGAAGLTEHVDEVRSRLDEALKEVRRSEVLDASTVTPEGRDLHEAVSLVEQDHEAIKAVTGRFLDKSLRLFRRHHGDGRISYWLDNPFPGRDWQTEVDGSLAGKYLVDAASVEGHVRVASYERSEALRFPGTRVLRAGDRLIDAVARMTVEQFEVGRIAAVWRRLPRTPDDRDWVLFGFHFFVGPGQPPMPQDWTPLITASARRRAERFLPTSIRTMWVGGDGTLVDPDSDEAFLAEMAFDASATGGDVGLFGEALRAIDGLLPRTWPEAVSHAFEVASSAVDAGLCDPRLIQTAKTDVAGRLGTVTGRTQQDEAQVDREQRISAWILESLESPIAHLDALSVVVLTTEAAPRVVRSMRQP
jgi:ATP-dependent helicase HepA